MPSKNTNSPFSSSHHYLSWRLDFILTSPLHAGSFSGLWWLCTFSDYRCEFLCATAALYLEALGERGLTRTSPLGLSIRLSFIQCTLGFSMHCNHLHEQASLVRFEIRTSITVGKREVVSNQFNTMSHYQRNSSRLSPQSYDLSSHRLSTPKPCLESTQRVAGYSGEVHVTSPREAYLVQSGYLWFLLMYQRISHM